MVRMGSAACQHLVTAQVLMAGLKSHPKIALP